MRISLYSVNQLLHKNVTKTVTLTTIAVAFQPFKSIPFFNSSKSLTKIFPGVGAETACIIVETDNEGEAP